MNPERPHEDAPEMPLESLDDLWFQVTGTLCNLECNHCFNHSGPGNRTFDMMSTDSVYQYLEESREFAVKEYYFTGGEPFLHSGLIEILDRALQLGPATVLTNATAFTPEKLDALQTLFHRRRYSLEIRVSLDGFTPETNDRIRGEGTFERAMKGVEKLVDRGLLPIITATRTWDPNQDPEHLEGFRRTLRQIGYKRARIKLLPSLKMGREEQRDRSYHATERVTHEMMKQVENEQFLCSNARLVTNRGVWACPILVLHSEARLGDTLADAMQSVSLGFKACYTCYLHGRLCSNMPSGETSGRSSKSRDRSSSTTTTGV